MHPFASIIGVAGVLLPSLVAAAAPVATYNYAISDFVENSTGTLIYGTVPSLNSIAVINTSTLDSTLVPIGSNPTGLALSNDGSKLFVANNGSNFIAVMNTQNNSLLPSLSLGSGATPLNLAVGTNNRLWVLVGAKFQFNTLRQIDATSGASTGANISAFIYDGRVRTSPDGTLLYYADYGTSPAYEYKFDVSGSTAHQLWAANLSGNGNDLALSKDGTLASFPFDNKIIQTSTNLALGSVGPGNGELAFSPDNAFAYTATSYLHNIGIYDLITFLQTGTILTTGEPQNLFVDYSGKYLLANEGDHTQVYLTGRVAAVPEPSAAACIVAPVLACFIRRRRRVA
jgi:DNA-binding beta-propeller fold protein YncE